ncbi:MAG: hypothetical protein HRU76_10390 [Phycisphaeraceae bacterium]|nr:hypothetical protein [Phycisphaerales bacterium]QOJ17967.1 MAG: hypothetical protein HRU76_10390 [Phycisphaeraceae bacterium]
MSSPVGPILERLDAALSALPGVFSTAQWGGRAYKLPGPGGSLKKPKLLAFVVVLKGDEGVEISFKLTRERAASVVNASGFIRPNSFGSLGRAGWLEARVTRLRQVETLRPLLTECRAMFGGVEAGSGSTVSVELSGRMAPRGAAKTAGRDRRTPAPANPVAAHIARVVEQARHELGWSPGDRDDF